MPDTPSPAPRRFSAHSLEAVRQRGCMVEGRTFEEAAMAFVEEWHPDADADGEASVIVEDCETGEAQCFRIDLGSGDAEPCG